MPLAFRVGSDSDDTPSDPADDLTASHDVTRDRKFTNAPSGRERHTMELTPENSFKTNC